MLRREHQAAERDREAVPKGHIKRPARRKKKKKTSSCWTQSFKFSSIVLKTIHILKCKETGKKDLDIKIIRKQFLCVLLRNLVYWVFQVWQNQYNIVK